MKPSSSLVYNNLEVKDYSAVFQQSESKTSSNGKYESFEFFDANLNFKDKTNNQIVESLMGEMLDTIESENSETDYVTQEMENVNEKEKIVFSPNTEILIPTMAPTKKVFSNFLQINEVKSSETGQLLQESSKECFITEAYSSVCTIDLLCSEQNLH